MFEFHFRFQHFPFIVGNLTLVFTPHSQDQRHFPMNWVFRLIWVPFKTGLSLCYLLRVLWSTRWWQVRLQVIDTKTLARLEVLTAMNIQVAVPHCYPIHHLPPFLPYHHITMISGFLLAHTDSTPSYITRLYQWPFPCLLKIRTFTII